MGYGVGQLPVGTFLSFEEARELVWEQRLRTKTQWEAWCDACSLPLNSNLIGFSSLTRVDRRCKAGKRPAMVPSHPSKTYADEGWLSWGDWLGTNKGHVAIPR